MKRQIKAGDTVDANRVINVSLDVVIPEDIDGSVIAASIESLVNRKASGKYRVAAADVGGDLTDIYERDYPDEMFI